MNRLLYWLLAICIPVICLWLLMPGDITQAEMATLCVRPDGANGCYVTIQGAVNAAASQDTILIAGGTYTESVTISQTLNLIGGWQPPGWPLTQTVIMGVSNPCTLCLDPSATGGSLSEITLTGGTSVGFYGWELGDYTLTTVLVQGYDTGVELTAPCPTAAASGFPYHVNVSETQFQSNVQAIQISCGYELTVTTSTFQMNDRVITGIGTRLILENDLFTHNGDVLSAYGGEWQIHYITLAENNGVAFLIYEDINCQTETFVTLESSIIWQNGNTFATVPEPNCATNPQAIPYYHIALGGSIVQGYFYHRHDPQFNFFAPVYHVNPLFWGNGDYRPRLPSPAIDGVPAGMTGVAVDILGIVRPQDGDSDGVARFDMGAYETMPGTVLRHYLPLSTR